MALFAQIDVQTSRTLRIDGFRRLMEANQPVEKISGPLPRPGYIRSIHDFSTDYRYLLSE